MSDVTDAEAEALRLKLHEEAEKGGYHLNPDADFTRELARGLLINERRYGYMACPCRRASGDKTLDLDIICPCDYRDPDLSEHDMCYCSLYVSGRVLDGDIAPHSIPERRPVKRLPAAVSAEPATGSLSALPYPVWRCKVCGYLCAREQPPELCPVCKARKERFELFLR